MYFVAHCYAEGLITTLKTFTHQSKSGIFAGLMITSVPGKLSLPVKTQLGLGVG
jgi:hypothetical protein